MRREDFPMSIKLISSVLTFLQFGICLNVKIFEPVGIQCKKYNYYFLTNESTYLVQRETSQLVITKANLGFNDQHRSNYFTDLWHREGSQQQLVLRSSFDNTRIVGDYDAKERLWTFELSHALKRPLDSSSPSKFILNIQSSLFMQSIDLILQNQFTNEAFCRRANSSTDVALCCQLCVPQGPCSDPQLLLEHTNKELTVTDRALVLHRFARCSKFPHGPARFWSTLTNGMDVGRSPDRFDLVIVQPVERTAQRTFHYSIYPFEQWKTLTTDFNFIDVLLIPHQERIIFELNICTANQCHIALRSYSYRLASELKLQAQLGERVVETNVSPSNSFHLYFHLLSNVFYLIGSQSIYTSMKYEEEMKLLWVDRTLSENVSRLNPVVYSRSGHIAFGYELGRETNCCSYFAVFTKAGTFQAFRTETFSSSTQLKNPFFFDSSGSFYFRSSPTTVIVESNQCSLFGTSHLMNTRLPGPFVIDQIQFDTIIHFCSLSSENTSLTFVHSMVRLGSLGSFFVMEQYSSPSLPYTFCLVTVNFLSDATFLTSARQCQLSLDIPLHDNARLHLTSIDCPWRKAEDENSTLIVPHWPPIHLEEVVNASSARGRLFRKLDAPNPPTRVERWHQFRLQDVEQILDRCSLTDVDAHHDRAAFVDIRPTTSFSVANRDEHAVKEIDLISTSDFILEKDLHRNSFRLIASPFDQRKSLIHQKFTPSQLSCSLPSTRTLTFISRCLPKASIRVQFDRRADLPLVKTLEPPVNFQLNRNEAGFPSVIVYNVDQSQSNLCDGLKNCSCVRSLISRFPLHCAEHFDVVDATVSNRLSMRLLMENTQLDVPTNQSLFFVEELSNRSEFRLLNQRVDQTKRKQILDLFANEVDRLTENEIYLLEFFHRTFPNESNFFFGPALELELLDEGLFHFRLTYLWSDQFCSTSRDLLIMMISHTSTITSYTWNYFFASLVVLFCLLLLWLTLVVFYEKIFGQIRSVVASRHRDQYFAPRVVEENQNFDILVRIREQSQRLLPYRHLISKTSPSNESYANQSQSSIISSRRRPTARLDRYASPTRRKEKIFLREHLKDLLKEIHLQ